MSGRFNLLYEPWIKTTDGREIGLIELFKCIDEPIFLGGDPLEVLAIFKLLQAITLSAIPCSEYDLSKLCLEDYSLKTCNYLIRKKEAFYLYHDETPFLQFPQAKSFKTTSYQALTPDLNDPSTNSTIIRNSQILSNGEITDAMLARRLIIEMGFSFSGKKIDLKQSISGTKYSSATPGPSLSYFGALHSLLATDNIVETLRFNHFTLDAFQPQGDLSLMVNLSKLYIGGIGIAPWEQMPKTEICPIAQAYKTTLMGRLIPLSRFCLIDQETKQIHYSMGIDHPGYKSGMYDPTQSFAMINKEYKILWSSSSKATWRQLPAILSFISLESNNRFTTNQLSIALPRMRMRGTNNAYLHSMGLEVDISMGETSVGSKCDYVHSCIALNPQQMGSYWFKNLTSLWAYMDYCAERINLACRGYCKDSGILESLQTQTSKVSSVFWSAMAPIAKQASHQLPKAQDIDFNNMSDKDSSELDKTMLEFKRITRLQALEAFKVINPTGTKRIRAYALNQPYIQINKTRRDKGVIT